MHLRTIFLTVFILLGWSCTVICEPVNPVLVGKFVQEMVRKHDFDEKVLTALFSNVKRSIIISNSAARPAEKTRTWPEYRKKAVTAAQIKNGVEFWRQNKKTLERAQDTYGVPEHIFVAILGIETRYGAIMGDFSVLSSLSNLAFHYPGDVKYRAKLFRDYLEQYLLLCREEGFNPLLVKGSYAGAMGMVQFMPTPFRRIAVDFDGDGKRDIWKSNADAIGSVGNYLMDRGWIRGGRVFSPANVPSESMLHLAEGPGIKTNTDIAALALSGVRPNEPAPTGDTKVRLWCLEEEVGTACWIGYHNFSVIGRYNPRLKYMMAVAHLGEELLKHRK
jgi:membrane-bound lytic murein transglycosylase B